MSCARPVAPVFVVVIALLFGASTALAGKLYVDTKKRFQLEPAGSWELAPIPGDVEGTQFKRKLDGGVPALFRIVVKKLQPGQTPKQVLDDVEASFRNEIGYNAGSASELVVGGLPALRRTFSVFASGDRNVVRAVEVDAIGAFGYVHLLHFETVNTARSSVARDFERMLGSYVPLVGREIAAPLAGSWTNTGGGPDLSLDEDGAFRMGPLSGGWRTDGAILELRLPQGAEKYRYALQGDTLTLSSPNLCSDGGTESCDMAFRRAGPRRGQLLTTTDDKKPSRTGEVKREELIGRWRVQRKNDDEPLVLLLSAAGSCQFGPLAGRWRFSTGRLTITSTTGDTMTYAAGLDGDKLMLSGGDLDSDLAFVRE